MDRFLTKAQQAVVEQAIHAGVPIIVDGVHGPTGKTTLCDELRRRGANAWEPWEVDEGLYSPNRGDGENTLALTIRLNRPLAHLRYLVETTEVR